MNKKYTQEQLDRAFDMVIPSTHWKDKINAVISQPFDQNLIKEAVIHFTATVPTFTELKNGTVRVKALGYWNGPAGDA